MNKRVHWDDNECRLVAKEFVRIRLKNITGSVNAQLAQAEAQVLPKDRRRNAACLAAYGEKLQAAVHDEMARILHIITTWTPDGSPVEPAPPPDSIVLPAPEPIVVEVQVPVIREIDRPVDFHKVMDATPPAILLGYVIAKILPLLSSSPLMTAVSPEALKVRMPDPVEIIKQATAPDQPKLTSPRRVLCIGFSTQFVESVKLKAASMTNIVVNFIDLRGYGGKNLACDYCVLAQLIGFRSPLSIYMSSKLGSKLRYMSELESEMMKHLADLNSLQVLNGTT